MMNKEEILAKSRKENKDADLYEKEVLAKGGNIGAATGAVVCCILFIIKEALGRGADYGLWAVIMSIEAALFMFKGVKLKRRHEIAVAAIYAVLALGLIAAEIFALLKESAIL